MNKVEIAQAIAVVRRTGVVNMFDRKGVIEVLYKLGYAQEAEIIEDNRDMYMEFLNLSGEY